MKQLTCEMCGSTDVVKQDGFFVCQTCGTKYSVEEARKMMIEVDGVVQVDSSHLVGNYLSMAQNAYDAGNKQEAESYCNKIIEVEPKNYQAWALKGKAAGWASTIQSLRFSEAVSGFSKALEYCPSELKDKLTKEYEEEIMELSHSLIKLRCDRFSNQPNESETSGFITDLSAIYDAMLQFKNQAGVSISVAKMMAPITKMITDTVTNTFKDLIYPDYAGQEGHPNDYDLTRYLSRIDYCILLLSKTNDLSDDDDTQDIERYRMMINLENYAIDGKSFDFKYELGWFGEYEQRWFVDKTLNNTAISARKQNINKYQAKIDGIQRKMDTRKAAERAERERIEKEKAKLRYDNYWAEHIAEKQDLQNERGTLIEQISNLKANIDEQNKCMYEEISRVPGKNELENCESMIKKLNDDKQSLGLFKIKEKRALQDQIDSFTQNKSNIEDRINKTKEEIRKKFNIIISDIQNQINALQRRVNEIDYELKRER